VRHLPRLGSPERLGGHRREPSLGIRVVPAEHDDRTPGVVERAEGDQAGRDFADVAKERARARRGPRQHDRMLGAQRQPDEVLRQRAVDVGGQPAGQRLLTAQRSNAGRSRRRSASIPLVISPRLPTAPASDVQRFRITATGLLDE
jgi:hypothetical protein